MSNKRLFQVLDEMNVNDEKNKTATCACCFDLVEAKTAKGGAHIVMGVPTDALHKIMLNEYKPMLVLLDMKEYRRIEALPVIDKSQEIERDLVKAKNLLHEVFQKHESGLLPDRFVYEKIKDFLYPENK